MVKQNMFLLVLFVLLGASCHTNNSDVADSELIILNNSFLNELDTIISEFPEVDTGCFSHFFRGFDVKKSKILVKISINNADTLFDFFVYDTSYRNESETVFINGTFTTPKGNMIQISDEEEVAKGIVYETHQKGQRMSIDLSHSLHKPMVLCDDRLRTIPPPQEGDMN